MNYQIFCKLFLIVGVVLVLQAGSQTLSGFSRQSIRNSSGQSFAPASEWRPTHAPAGAKYLGNAACAECHTQVETQPSTPMGSALETVNESRILKAHAKLNFRLGQYFYQITRQGNQSLYSVSDGQKILTVPLLYAFGQGKAGQTYVFEKDGKYYESRVSFFNAINGLDLTLGAPRTIPTTVEEAAGRMMDSADTKDCFSCHAAAAVSESRLQLDKMTPGITCEGCHGPGDQHVSLIRSRKSAIKDERSELKSETQVQVMQKSADKTSGSSAILNPGRFDTEGQTQFCGSCHRTWSQVQLMRVQGVSNVRFQPYRIFSSKCYDFDDKRISCTACHNPHEELKHDAAFYDAKCLSCHQAKTESKVVCKAGKKQDCASCHMPKYELPGSHFRFTDHFIRVTRPGETYPN